MGKSGEEIHQEGIRRRINEVICDIEKQVCTDEINMAREHKHNQSEVPQSTSHVPSAATTKLQYRRNSKFAQISIDDSFDTNTSSVADVVEPQTVSSPTLDKLPAKFLQPPDEQPVIVPNKKAMFVDSAFFSPLFHPTWEQQVQLARQISSSLSDSSNQKSRGQSMYEKRKRRCEMWIHQESLADCDEMTQKLMPGFAEDFTNEEPSISKNKPLLKLLMKPNGQVYDIHSLKSEDRAFTVQEALSPEICSDLVKDLNSPQCKGAQMFAKRKKRSQDWIVGSEHWKDSGAGRPVLVSSGHCRQDAERPRETGPQSSLSVCDGVQTTSLRQQSSHVGSVATDQLPVSRCSLENRTSSRTQHHLVKNSSQVESAENFRVTQTAHNSRVPVGPGGARDYDLELQLAEQEFHRAALQLMNRSSGAATSSSGTSSSTTSSGSSLTGSTTRSSSCRRANGVASCQSNMARTSRAASEHRHPGISQPSDSLTPYTDQVISRGSRTGRGSDGKQKATNAVAVHANLAKSTCIRETNGVAVHKANPASASGVVFNCAVTLQPATAAQLQLQTDIGSQQLQLSADIDSQQLQPGTQQTSSTQPAVGGDQCDSNATTDTSYCLHQPVFGRAKSGATATATTTAATAFIPNCNSGVFQDCSFSADDDDLLHDNTLSGSQAGGPRALAANYNTAARGWGAVTSYYRPLTFALKQ